MNRTKNTPLRAAGLFAAAILAVTTSAYGVNMLAYYPCDSPSTATSTPRTVGTGTGGFAANATISTSSLLPYGNMFGAGYLGNAFIETSAAGGGAANSNARLSFGAGDPFAATGSFTYSLWFYTPSTFTGTAQTFILSKFGTANSATQLDFKLMLRPADLQLMTFSPALNGVATVQTTPTMTSGNGWNHYAITAARSGNTVTWGVYQNGNPISFNGGINSAGISTSANSIGLTIGKNAGTANFGFEGVRADEIAFYDQVLTQTEIQHAMMYGPVSVPEPSALALALVGGLIVLIRRRRS